MRIIFVIIVMYSLGALTAAGSNSADKLGEYDFELKEMTTEQDLDLELLTEELPLIVHVWAPDCPHCKRHMPYVAALYKKLDPKQANFISCSMSDNAEDTAGFMADKKLTFAVMLESSGKLGDGFYKQGWPTTFIFAPGGEFVGWCDTNGPAYLTEVMDLVEQAAAVGN